MSQPVRKIYCRRSQKVFQFLAILFLAGDLAAQTVYFGYSNYQIITDADFRYTPYFSLMKANGVNFQRIWILGYSGTAPKIEETLPFQQKGFKYKLRELRPDYLQRMQIILQAAKNNGQQVMLTLFDHWSLATPEIFPKTPWYFKNNTDRLLKRSLPDFFDLKNRKLMEIQKNYVQEIVGNAQRYRPIYEIMNEAAGADCSVLSAWHQRVTQWIHGVDPDARIAVNLMIDCPEILHAPWVNVVSFHGNDWAKKGICPLAKSYSDKIVVIDTDGAWKTRDDNVLVSDWLNQARSCGASFNHKDDIYMPDLEVLQLIRESSR
jgi:Cellulase (glycosyl hydrolase family 5)